MSKAALARALEKAGVHRDVLSWAETQSDWPSAWKQCPRGDWLLAFAARFGSSPTKVAIATIDAVEAAVTGTYLETIYQAPLATTRAALQAGQSSVDPGALDSDSSDPNVAALADAIGLLREVENQPAVGAAVAAQVVSVVVAASGDCATMPVIRYTHQVMADAVRRTIAEPPPFEVGTPNSSE